MLRITWIVLFFIPFSIHALGSVQLELASIETAFFKIGQVKLEIVQQDLDHLQLSAVLNDITSTYLEDTATVYLECSKVFLSEQVVECLQGSIAIKQTEDQLAEEAFSFSYDLFQKTIFAKGNLPLFGSDINFSYNKNSNSVWELDMDIENLQLSSFSGVFRKLLSEEFETIDGILSMNAIINGEWQELSAVQFDGNISELNVDGPSVFEGVNIKTSGAMDKVAGDISFSNNFVISEGAMYIQPGFEVMGDQPGFYIEATPGAIEVKVVGNWISGDKLLDIKQLNFTHPGTLQTSGSAKLQLSAEDPAQEFSLHVDIGDLEKSFPSYLQPLLLQTNFSDLELSGGISVDISYKAKQLESLRLILDEIYLDDINSKFSISGLSGRFKIDDSSVARQSDLNWSGMSFYRLDIGAGDILFESIGTDIRVLEWQDVNVLDGTLQIDNFNVRGLGSPDFELSVDGRLTPVSMQELTHSLDWIILPGKLSGLISGLSYTRNNLELNGDIAVRLFDGEVTVHNLSIQNIFSSYSILSTDIDFKGLDLEQLTDVFTFGKIEGSLDGRMHGLVLEDWQPSYFTAEFATPEDDDRPHRISQKALENLNELGGGLSGTLSQGFVRFLPAYSYGQLGISCRLNNGVCELGGVGQGKDGFHILTRGGLFPPWVEVKGTGRLIKWDELIGGLKQIADGEISIE